MSRDINPLGAGDQASTEIGGNIRLMSDNNTGEMGLQIKMTNKTGGNTVKGTLVTASDGTASAFKLSVVNEPDIIGVVYQAGVADAGEAWIWIQGKVQVKYVGATTLEHFARNIVTADSGASGDAASEALPTSPFATDKHFQEIGHVVEAIGGAGLALTVIHFN